MINMWLNVVLFVSTSLLLEVHAVSLLSNSSNGSPQRSASKIRWKRDEDAKCILPSQPDNGHFKLKGGTVTDGQAAFMELEYSCSPGHALHGGPNSFCWAGVWNDAERPRCIPTCNLKRHRSMQYNCIICGADATRPCRDEEPDGTVVRPTCQKPHYYTPLELPYMVCRQGHWNVWPTCVPAARCFWNKETKEIRDAANYAVAVGKLYSDWGNTEDAQYAQKSDVKKIAVPKQFRGEETNYQDDIAVVVVTRSFDYQLYMRPVCLDFRQELFEKHLRTGSVGKVATWNPSLNGEVSIKKLEVIDLPFINNGDCSTKTAAEEQFCAGTDNGQMLCGIDAGSGIAFPATIQNTTRFYLRGVAAVIPGNEGAHCNTPVTFTSLAKHQNLIKTYWYL